ncbi:MAG: hypothetical protein K0S51_1022 [Bacillales bacterium]|jgi:HlyD family secretion protein|nr:hypothetical protein [Bacillales bacterium]
MKSYKKVIVFLLIVALVIGGYMFFKPKEEVKELEFTTVKVEKGDLEVSVSGNGTIQAINRENITVTSMAKVDEIKVSLNEKVKKGDELITFENDVLDPIEAQFDGTISKLDVEEGATVNPGQLLGEIVNYDNLELKVQIDELDIAKVVEGQAANVTFTALEDEEFAGKVKSISKEGIELNGVSSFEVVVTLPVNKKFRIGMSGEAIISTAKKENVLYVPIESVEKKDKKHIVLVPDEDKSKQAKSSEVEVQVGIHNEDYIEITSGLIEGEEVITRTKTKNNSGFPFGGGRHPGSDDDDSSEGDQ